jgi:hypothetical protein
VAAGEGFGGRAGDLFLAVRESREPRPAGSTVRRAKIVVVGSVVVKNCLQLVVGSIRHWRGISHRLTY